VFAIGATIYYLLTGYLPLSPEYQHDKKIQPSDFNPVFPPITEKRPDVSPELERVLQTALNLEADRRYPNATELGTALRNIPGIAISVEPHTHAKQAKPKPPVKKKEKDLSPATPGVKTPASARPIKLPLKVLVPIFAVALLIVIPVAIVATRPQEISDTSPQPPESSSVQQPKSSASSPLFFSIQPRTGGPSTTFIIEGEGLTPDATISCSIELASGTEIAHFVEETNPYGESSFSFMGSDLKVPVGESIGRLRNIRITDVSTGRSWDDHFYVDAPYEYETTASQPSETTELLFEDDFSDPDRSIWYIGGSDSDSWQFENGEYSMWLKEQHKIAYSLVKETTSNFIVEVDVRNVIPDAVNDNETYCGIMFGIQQDDISDYSFFIGSDQYYILAHQTGDSVELLEDWTFSNYIKAGSASNRLKLVYEDKSIKLYVNEQFITSINVSSDIEGWIALAVGNSEGNIAHYHFDNFKLQEIE
jgi:hypothetical protein